MFFGDSICAGSDVPGGGRDDAWPQLFQRENSDLFDVDNQSRGGRPTSSLDEFDVAISREPAPDVLVIALAANDSRDLDEGMVQRACSNVEEMARRAGARGVRRIAIIGPYNINKDALKQSYPIRHERERNLLALDEAYAALAKRLGALYVRMYGAIPEKSLSFDGVHPDPAGNVPLKEAFEKDFIPWISPLQAL